MFCLMCEETRCSIYKPLSSCSLYTTVDYTLLYYTIRGCSTLLVNCIILPWLLVFFLCRMKPWWDPCSCLKTWCRTRGDDGDKENEEGLVWVLVCGCICAISGPFSSPRLIQPWSGYSQSMSWMKGLDWNAFCFPAEIFSTQYRATDVTDSDITDITVLEIGLLKIEMLLRYMAAPDQQKATVQPAEPLSLFFFQTKCMLLQKFWVIAKHLLDLLWEFGHKNFYCIFISCIWWLTDMAYFKCHVLVSLLRWPLYFCVDLAVACLLSLSDASC